MDATVAGLIGAGDHQSRRELIDLLRHTKSLEPASPKHGQGGVLIVPGMATDADAWEKRVAANQAQYRGNCGNPAATDES